MGEKVKGQKKIISAEEVANYVVCPEAWRLKYLQHEKQEPATRKEQGRELRREWIKSQDLSATLRSYAKVAYVLLWLLVIVVFLLEHRRTTFSFRRNTLPVQNSASDQASSVEK